MSDCEELILAQFSAAFPGWKAATGMIERSYRQCLLVIDDEFSALVVADMITWSGDDRLDEEEVVVNVFRLCSLCIAWRLRVLGTPRWHRLWVVRRFGYRGLASGLV